MPERSEGIIFSKILTERSEVNIFKNNTNEMSVIFAFNARACECIKYKHPIGKAHRIMPGVPRRRSDYIYYNDFAPFVAQLVCVKGLFLGG